MKTVKELLKAKGSQVWSISPSTTVYQALEVMSEKGVGALAVMEEEQLVGMISERDYARKIILAGRSSKETLTREIMSTRIFFVRPETTVQECMALMTEQRVRHLPVLEGQRLAGIVSIGDAIKTIIADQQIMIEQLSSYITGKYV